MGEAFWRGLLYVLAKHVKTLPIPDFFKRILVLALIGVLISTLLAFIAAIIKSLRDKEDKQKRPIKKTLPQRTGKVLPERILCLDESCTGTIGDDGCCGYCGKPFAQAKINEAVKQPMQSYPYRDIFLAVEKQLIETGSKNIDRASVLTYLNGFKHFEERSLTDDEYFNILVWFQSQYCNIEKGYHQQTLS
jgi:hypothetical protein